MKSSCSSSDRSDAWVIAVETWSPPPFASARFVNASMWRASSFDLGRQEHHHLGEVRVDPGMNRAGT